MLRLSLITLALAFALAKTSESASAEHSPDQFACFTVHGSIAPAVGHPTYRISPETSTGLLAVRDDDRQPAKLWSLFPTDQRAVETTVSGDFYVCPLEPSNPNGLRLVRIKSARNLKRNIDDWLEQKDH